MNSLKVLHFDENFNFNSYGLTVGNLFEHVGITLDKTSISEHSVPIISDKVLNQISEIAVIKSGMSQHPSAQKISANIFFTLQEYFNQNTVCINNLALKNDLVNMMGKYLIMQDVLELREQFEWRGLGFIPHSALKIKAEYKEFDAEVRFQLADSIAQEHKQCLCGDVLRGIKKPKDCKLFAKVCVPENPLGSCMVSSEGACAAVYAYGRVYAS